MFTLHRICLLYSSDRTLRENRGLSKRGSDEKLDYVHWLIEAYSSSPFCTERAISVYSFYYPECSHLRTCCSVTKQANNRQTLCQSFCLIHMERPLVLWWLNVATLSFAIGNSSFKFWSENPLPSLRFLFICLISFWKRGVGWGLSQIMFGPLPFTLFRVHYLLFILLSKSR